MLLHFPIIFYIFPVARIGPFKGIGGRQMVSIGQHTVSWPSRVARRFWGAPTRSSFVLPACRPDIGSAWVAVPFYGRQYNKSPLIGPKKEINRDNEYLPLFVLLHFELYTTGFSLFPKVPEGLRRSGKLVGTISTYPGTCKCLRSRVMAKNPPGGEFFLTSTVCTP